MKYQTILKNGALIVAASLLTLAACKRSTNATPALTSSDDNGGYATDAATLENTSNDVISISDVAAAGNGSTLRVTSPCATVTRSVIGTDSMLTINFGAADCLCADGKTRKGEIIVSYTGAYKDSGTVRTITYNNYYVNDNKVTGSKSVTNVGTNSSGEVWYNVVLNDTITLTTDSVISWTAHRTRTWLTGYTTATRDDDSYSIADATGSAGTVLTRANGHVFTFSITSPLKIAYDCNYIESGILDISSSTFTGGDRILDYSYSLTSTGSCDDLAKLTIGSHTYIITLR